MTDNGRRHPRIPSDEPAAIAQGDATYDGRLTDYSDSGAAIAFSLPQGDSRLRIDVGEQVNVESVSLDRREGRVVRHYDGGFALNFEGFQDDSD